jgi:hypothetical protein
LEDFVFVEAGFRNTRRAQGIGLIVDSYREGSVKKETAVASFEATLTIFWHLP